MSVVVDPGKHRVKEGSNFFLENERKEVASYLARIFPNACKFSSIMVKSNAKPQI